MTASTPRIDNIETTFSPSGIISAYAGITTPAGWMTCDGSEISRETYADLFMSIGTLYGAGDGSTAFKLPDLRGMFLRGTGTHGSLAKAAGGNYAGPSVGSSTLDKMQGHWHDNEGVLINAGTRLGAGTTPFYATTGQVVFGPKTDGTNGTPRTGNETAPVNIGVNYIIKL